MAKLLFVAIVALGTWYVWHRRDSAHGRAMKRILLLGFAGLVIFTILFPETTTVVASCSIQRREAGRPWAFEGSETRCTGATIATTASS